VAAAGTSPTLPAAQSILLLLAAAVLSTILGAALVQKFGNPFRIPPSVTAGIQVVASPEQAAKVSAAKSARDAKNACVTFAIIGTISALCFAVALGSSVLHSRRQRVVASVGGSLYGAVAGAIAGAIAAIVCPTVLASLQAEHKTILAEALGWAIIGIGAGTAVALAVRSRRAWVNGTFAAFAGGLIGGALYVPVVSLLIPSVDTEQIIPDVFAAKLVWIALPVLGVAFGMGRALVQNAGR
jgi:hypothetical protein